METETYNNRNVPRIFTKYNNIHSIGRFFSDHENCSYWLCYLQNYRSNCEVVVSMRGTLKIASIIKVPPPLTVILLKQQVRKTGWHTYPCSHTLGSWLSLSLSLLLFLEGACAGCAPA